ncbi:hypothetical protein/internalin A [Amycolatopsis pretoriensis]|uniref:non-specific serine/threonine protein kinase n=1 Tax=Amycolatopsis pretoriensis TaxID=218821 RepID=A0A1H5QRL7_9PSEU|nr:COR domain-containing protein [Amycolatopsis pretoriensis]SEF28474.1 hypothetical protein/internalin A [Amycolatopsis pretoriensis]
MTVSSSSEALDLALQQAKKTGKLNLSEFLVSAAELRYALNSIDELDSIHLRRLNDINIPFNLISERFPKLRTLELDACGLNGFPPRILKLSNLQELSLSNNPINELPSSIGQLEKLEVLMTAGCRLTSLPHELGQLKKLRALHLANNRLQEQARTSEFPLPPSLEYLLLWANELTEIPPRLQKLANLKVLSLSASGTKGTLPAKNARPKSESRWPYANPDFPSSLSLLIGVSSGIQGIDQIPEWLFESCPDLQWIDLADNHLDYIPQNIRNLRNLKGAVFTGNLLTEFPRGLLGLDEIEVIDLASNLIDTLPTTSPLPATLKALCLGGNPLPVPPEIIDLYLSPTAIWSYSQDSSDARPLGEAKLLVVGEGSVGKTSLIRRLVSDQFDSDERKTEGIEITRWQPATAGDSAVTVNAWDFGGQEIMHATHQFFLTKRSVYLLVLDARQSEDQNRVEYWLKIIQGFSAGSPVIIVGNKCEGINLDIDRRGLRIKYPNIVAICETSCAEVAGIRELADVIVDTVDDLPHVWDLLPVSFFRVKEYLEQLEAAYLPYNEYEATCGRFGITTAQSRELLIGFLHDLGTVLCFRDDPRLRDTNILSPRWVTGGVYRILNSNLAGQLKGLLEWRNIDTILSGDEYPPSSRIFIVEMMKKFELCFESEGRFLVPDLLTKEEPDTGDWADTLRFSIRYEVLPLSVMSRLIVRMNRLVSKGTVWRTGVVLRMDQNRALLKADREDSVLAILVGGPHKGRRGLLTAIRAELRAIEATIPGLTGSELVPVPGHGDVWVPYDHLLRLEEAGRASVIPEGLTDEFSISVLLSGVEESANRALVSSKSAGTLSVGGTDPVPAAEAAPWTLGNSLKLGGFLVVALILVAATYVGVSLLLDTAAALAIAGAALLVIVVVGLFVLRSGGRIGEQTMLDGIKNALSTKPGGSEDDER